MQSWMFLSSFQRCGSSAVRPRTMAASGSGFQHSGEVVQDEPFLLCTLKGIMSTVLNPLLDGGRSRETQARSRCNGERASKATAQESSRRSQAARSILVAKVVSCSSRGSWETLDDFRLAWQPADKAVPSLLDEVYWLIGWGVRQDDG